MKLDHADFFNFLDCFLQSYNAAHGIEQPKEAFEYVVGVNKNSQPERIPEEDKNHANKGQHTQELDDIELDFKSDNEEEDKFNKPAF